MYKYRLLVLGLWLAALCYSNSYVCIIFGLLLPILVISTVLTKCDILTFMVAEDNGKLQAHDRYCQNVNPTETDC